MTQELKRNLINHIEKLKEKYSQKTPKWGILGYVIYKRTYARFLEQFGRTEEFYETVARCLKGAVEMGVDYTIDELTRLYDYHFNFKGTLAGRDFWQIGSKMFNDGIKDPLINCFAYETEVLTRQGWKKIGDLQGQEVEIVTSMGKWIKAPISKFGKDKLYKLIYRDARRQSTHTVFTTANHKWFTSQGNLLTTLELKPNTRLRVTKGKNACKTLSPQGIAHGIVYGDGCLTSTGSEISLIDEKITDLEKYFVNNKFREYQYQNKMKRFYNLPNYYKKLPDINESKSYLMGFLAGIIATDGSINKDFGTIRVYNISQQFLSSLRDIASVLGFRTTKVILDRDGETNYGNHNPLYRIDFFPSDNPDILVLREKHKKYLHFGERPLTDYVTVLSVEETDRYEDVFCATVEDTHSFVIEGNVLTHNCHWYTIHEYQSFIKIFDELMLGGGCGFGVEKEYIEQLPIVKDVHNISFDNDESKSNLLYKFEERLRPYLIEAGGILKTDFENGKQNSLYIVGDSREGWVQILDDILTSFFVTGESFKINTNFIRAEGELIKGFGGKSSGSKYLIEGLTKVIEILMNAKGRKLSSVEVVDIVCVIASIVVSGNVRRSALLALGDKDDINFITCKRWDLYESIPQYRAMVNLTINTNSTKDLPEEFWDSYTKDGEAIGLFNRDLAQKAGRTGVNLSKDLNNIYSKFNRYEDNQSIIMDGLNITEIMADKHVSGVNPCSEANLSHGETCCLAEIYLPNIESEEELNDVAQLLYKFKKHVTQGTYIYTDSMEVINKNARIGIGITGVMQALDKIQWLSKAYENLRDYDLSYSIQHNMPISRKLTVLKPSGTLSLLAGVSSGIHPFYAKYYYRTVRMSFNDILWKVCKKHGCKVEDLITKTDKNGGNVVDKNTKVVYFPMKAPDNSLVANDVTTIQQLNYVREMQENWVDQSVSVTAYYDKETLPEIREYLDENFTENFKTLSFLQHSGHEFLQAPYIEITEEEYEKAFKKFKPINSLDGFIDDGTTELEDTFECKNGFCSIK